MHKNRHDLVGYTFDQTRRVRTPLDLQNFLEESEHFEAAADEEITFLLNKINGTCDFKPVEGIAGAASTIGHEQPTVIVSLDVDEVLRMTMAGILTAVTGKPRTKKEAWHNMLGPGRKFSYNSYIAEQVSVKGGAESPKVKALSLLMSNLVINNGLALPMNYSGDINQQLTRITEAGGVIIANTSTSSGTEQATIQQLWAQANGEGGHKNVLSGIGFARTYEGEGRSKSDIIKAMLAFWGIPEGEVPVLHIDDLEHHRLEVVREVKSADESLIVDYEADGEYAALQTITHAADIVEDFANAA